MRSTVYVRNFESTLRMLADRGHDVHVVAHPHPPDPIDLICRESPRVRYSPGLAVPVNPWSFLGIELRRAADYLRYFGPEYADASYLRRRAKRRVPQWFAAALQRPLVGSRAGDGEPRRRDGRSSVRSLVRVAPM